MKKQKIESIYPLSAMQQGLLFHTLYEGGSGTYYEQMSCRIEGDLQVEPFKRAWQAVLDRHPILRTSFVWEGVKQPVQVVQQGLKLAFRQEDWRGITPAEQSRKLEELLREERERGFDLSKGPLMKVGLVRVAEDAYYFIWGNHHILFDGWCRQLIIGEVFKLYEGYSRGVEVEMGRARPYRDYIVWLGEQDLSEAEEYWREELRGIEGPTQLGIERGGVREGAEYEERTVRVSEEASRRLEEVAKRWQVTLNTVVEGGWSVVMSRYSGQQEVVFGTTMSGRGGGLKGIEGMVGLFINTLPVRVEVRGEEGVREVMRRVQEKQVKVLENEHSPLMEVQGWSGVGRGVSLFEVAYMFQNYPMDGGIRKQAGSSLQISEIQRFSNNNYQLVIRAIPGKELLLNTIYDSGRYEAIDTERLLNHLKRVLEGMAENEQSRVNELPMMSRQEQEEVIVEWNQTVAEYPRESCVHEIFEQQVEQTPEAVAVVYEGEQLSYEELNRRANQLGHYLREMGVGPEMKVGLCVGRGLEMIVGLLGVMKAGGAYLPLDANYPQERLAYMIEDSGCPVIVATRHSLEQLPVTWAQIVMIDDDWPAIAGSSDGNPELTTVPANLAYMIYTSGSTGKPKGVGLTHQGLCNLAVAQNRNLQVAAGASVLQFASISFDAATWEWLMTLTRGAKLILISEADVQSPDNVLELIVKHEVETVTLPPSVLMSAEKRSIPTLKTMVVAGEACPNELVRQWSGECRFVNAYGPTESTVCATMTGTMVYGEKAGIGRANENTQIYILDRNQEPMPVGVTGEIYIAGAGLARGYLNRSDLTAEKFQANPFARGERMYRSGDLGRYHRDGSIEYLGRVDHQVKVRGYRIELGEIEAVLNEHPAVAQAVVLAREDEPGEKRLVGYVVGHREVSSQELKKYLQERLPDYMVAGAIVQLEEMPLTANGKIDRRALPEPEQAVARTEYVGPRSAVEEIVSGIWAEVLRVERVGITDNFFELGGHSLLATQVVSRVRNVLGVDVPLRSLFTHPTAAAMASEVEQQRRSGGQAAVEEITRVGREGELPLSYAQARLWFIDQMEPGSAAYNIPCAVRLSGSLDADALSRSLNEIVRRHEVLRTSFPSSDGEPRQHIHENGELRPDIIDLMQSDEAEREQKLQEVLREEARRGFDLSSGPLIRAKLIRMSEDEHVLMVNMHHIVSDGWSMEVMVREFAYMYESYTKGQESPLPELEIQYADYAVWQREWLQGEVLHTQLEYWKRELEGVGVLELPTDRARPVAASNRGASERIELSEEVTEKLKQMSRREGVTLFMSLLAGFQVLLGRYSGQSDIAVGTPIAGRNRREIEGLIGFFVNTLVMRANVGDNPTVREMLARVRETALGAYAHQDVPFEKLVEELQPERSLSHTPLFQVMMAFQSRAVSEVEIGELKAGVMEVEARTAKFDLLVSLRDRGRELTGVVEYNSDLYEATSVQRLVGHFEVLMKGIMTDGNQRLSQLPMMSRQEREEIIVEWNRTAAEYPRDRCVHEIFEQQVEQTPEAVAVVYEGESLTYDELNRRANQLAHYLREKGVGPEVKVGLCVERSLEMIIGLVGVMKAGGAYLPLDVNYPPERLAYMIEDAECRIILCKHSQQEKLIESKTAMLRLDADWGAIAQQSEEATRALVSSDNLAYVIYTSGSTGKPKGVAVEQRNIVKLVRNVNYAELSAQEVFLQYAPLTFDASTFEIWGCLLNGGRMVVCSSEAQSLEQLGKVVQEDQITTAWLTAGLFHQMVDERIEDLKNLRQILAGGEALSVRHVLKGLSELPDCRLINGYGPTECTTFSSTFTVTEAAELVNSVPIGHPITNTHIYILSENQEPAPVGVTGEIYIAGQGLARSYLNQADETAEKFMADPFGEEGRRMYRTGDLGRHKRDGSIEYQGRIDHQVKIRGYRIELGEIEAVLNEHPAVAQVVVLAREDEPGEKRLVGYVVGDQEVSSQELREYLQERLPDYMVPGAILQVDEMPLTANGKLDRRALPKPEMSGGGREYEGARTAVEEIVSGIWAEVLRVERVGIRDNFFELGGHSLLAMQLVSRVRNILGVEITLRSLFTNPTVAAMATEIEQLKRTRERTPVPPLIRSERGEDLPLSYAQQRLWFIDQLEAGSAAYNIPSAVRLSGSLDTDALCKSLNEIVRRHEVLRTSFPSSDGEPRQHIDEYGGLRPDIIDLMQSDEAEREEKLEEELREEARRGFDLSRGPLIRAKLVRMAEDEHVLMVNMHHIVSDGWSMEVIVRELAHLYEAFSQGREPSLPELEIQYADYAVWQREWLQGEVLQTQLEYWKRELEGVGVLELPTDRARPAAASYQGASERIELCEEVTEKLKQMSRREGVTLFMTLMAGFQALLARYSGQTDIAVGTPIAGRNMQETEGLIGFFLNTLVMRANVEDNPTVSELLARVRETALSAYAHQDVPFEKLVEELQPERTLSHQPLFQVWFVLQNIPTARVDLADLSMKMFPIEDGFTKFDLMLAINEGPQGMAGSLRYSTDLFERNKIQRMLFHLTRVLEGMADNEQSRVMELPLMSEQERQEVIVEWNQTVADYPRDRCVHELFQQQMEQTPEAVAVVYEGEQLTYDALNRRANQLAHYLQKLGVGPEVKVGLCLERSIDMIVGLLGVMKAGGAYLPLDPAYPQERLDYMIEDASATVVLTQQRWKERLEPCSRRLLCLDEQCEIIDQQSDHELVSHVGADNLAYIIYTSGSTGRPKGVMLRHRSLMNYLMWAAGHYPVGIGRGAPVHSSLSFDLTITSLLTPLLVGGYVELLSNENEVESLAEALRGRKGYGLVKLTPGHLRLLAELLKGDNLDGAAESLVIGGENLPVEAVRWWRERAARTRLFNEYGPTESVVGCCVYEVSPQLEAEEGRDNVSIGRAIANTRLYVLDQRYESVPKGVVGELYIGGEGLARGYLNHADLTAQSFVPSVYSEEAGGRVYRTGDQARYEEDGKIEFLGRVDDQVKVRGYRIELGEIEAALNQHERVQQAVVVAREDEPGQRRLVAYLVVKHEVSSQELRAYLGEKLPDYMVPSAFVEIEQMPLTANGKIDRRALPRPELAALRGGHVAARTAVEEILCGIWSEVLGVEQVGVEDNFFELGGDSILSIQVIARARQAGLQLTPRQFFERQTIAGLAEIAGANCPVETITKAAREGELPLSYGQARLWFMDQMEPGSAAYNIPAAVRLMGRLDEQALQKSLNEIVRRHEVLRTSFPSSDGQPCQLIHEEGELRPEVIDLINSDEAEREEKLQEVLREEARTGFDLEKRPLIRAKLIKMGEDEHILTVVMHHIVSDGWSMDVMIREFTHLYEAYSQGRESALPELEIQYADYAMWQREWLQGEVLHTQLEYWKRELEGVGVLELPTDRPRPAVASYRGASESIQLSEELTQKLKQLSRREGVTLFMTLMAGLQALLARYSGQTDIAVGTPIAGRNMQETESLIGFFLNTLVMRANVGDNPTVRELLAKVREAALSAYAHQDVPFEKLVEEIRPERNLSYQPLFQVWFVMQNTPPLRMDLPGLRVERFPIEVSFTKFDLMLSLGEGEKELAGTLRYSTDLFDRRRIRRMLSHYESILEGMAADEQSHSKEHDMEREQYQYTAIP